VIVVEELGTHDHTFLDALLNRHSEAVLLEQVA